MNANVVLVGLEEAERAEVANTVARYLGYEVYDLNRAITARLGLPPLEAIEARGEAEVRCMEETLVSALSAPQGLVVAGDLGVTETSPNRKALDAGGIVVRLGGSSGGFRYAVDEGPAQEVARQVLALVLPLLLRPLMPSAQVVEVGRSRAVVARDDKIWTFLEIAEEVEAESGIELEVICARGRTRHVVRARHVLMYLCRRLTSLTLAEIGARTGGRDHTTALYAHEQVAAAVARGERVVANLIAATMAALRQRQAKPQWVSEIHDLDPEGKLGPSGYPGLVITYTRRDGSVFTATSVLTPL